jgi:transcriptional regulator with XRE-family HTH domain
MLLSKKLGQNIRKIRELRNFTQQYMAENLQMTQGNYARLENEEIQMTEARLEKIASVLGCDPATIIEFTPEIFFSQKYRPEKQEPVIQFQISPELKRLYEDRIKSLEDTIMKLKAELASYRGDDSAEQQVEPSLSASEHN